MQADDADDFAPWCLRVPGLYANRQSISSSFLTHIHAKHLLVNSHRKSVLSPPSWHHLLSFETIPQSSKCSDRDTRRQSVDAITAQSCSHMSEVGDSGRTDLWLNTCGLGDRVPRSVRAQGRVCLRAVVTTNCRHLSGLQAEWRYMSSA